jgi:16S rRNA processing protein RimM
MLDEYLVIGEILKPQGVKGEVKVRPITFDLSRFEGLERVFFKTDAGAYEKQKVRVNRINPDAVYMTVRGFSDRTAAEKLRGQLLYVDRASAAELPEDAEFICDLIGCVATDDSGRTIGTLTEVMQPGAGDVYVFQGPLGEVLVPALKSVFLKVDVVQKSMLLSSARLAEVAVFEE